VLGGENFTLESFFHRCDRLTALAVLRVLRRSEFTFPQHDSSWKWDERCKGDQADAPLPDSFDMSTISLGMLDGQLAAAADMLWLGVDVHKFKAVYAFDEGALKELDSEEVDEGERVVPPPPKEAVQLVSVRAAQQLRDSLYVVADRGGPAGVGSNSACRACTGGMHCERATIALMDFAGPRSAVLCDGVPAHQPAGSEREVCAAGWRRDDLLCEQGASFCDH